MPTSTLNQIRAASPLIHCITNYVTVNDVANVLLAIGARPIMADDPEEVEEITALSAGLCLNIGTLNVSEEITCGSRKGFDITSLSFGKNRVESKRRFARTG